MQFTLLLTLLRWIDQHKAAILESWPRLNNSPTCAYLTSKSNISDTLPVPRRLLSVGDSEHPHSDLPDGRLPFALILEF